MDNENTHLIITITTSLFSTVTINGAAKQDWKFKFRRAMERALIAYGCNRAGFHSFYK